MCVCVLTGYLKAEGVEAGVCPAAHWAIRFNLHGIEQVLVMETRRPADLKLGLPNAAGTRVMQLRKKNNTLMTVRFSSLLSY